MFKSLVPGLRNLSLLFSLVLSVGAWAEPAIKIQVLTFGEDSFWGATNTVLEPVADSGLYRTVSSANLLTGGSCGDLLQSFQQRPLEVMLDNGYISKAVFAQLMNFEALGIRPRQLTLITEFSDLTEHEVRSYFPDGIPEDRPWERRMGDNGQTYVRMNRGTVYIARSYDFGEVDGKIVPVPRPMPWELDRELPNGMSERLDRTRFPYAVEIGRAFAENKPIAGDFRLAVKIATGILANDFQILKVDPSKVLITAHFLDAQHTRLFTKLFPLRIMDSAVLAAIESRGSVPADYLDQPQPKTREEWASHGNALVYGSLKEFEEQYPIEKSSYRLSELAQLFPAGVKPKDLRAIIDEQQSIFRWNIDYELPGFGRGTKPLIIRDVGTGMMITRSAGAFSRHGMSVPYDQLESHLKRLTAGNQDEPDMTAARFFESAMYLPAEGRGSKGMVRPMYIVENLDPNLSASAGRYYPISIALALYDKVDQWITHLSPAAYNTLLADTNRTRAEGNQGAVTRVDRDIFFETQPICFGSQDPRNLQVLKDMGARILPGMAISFVIPLSEDRQVEALDIKVQVDPTSLYCFDHKQLKSMSELYHAFYLNGRDRLKYHVDHTIIKLLNSASF